jgi:DNA-directed RNA polymerase subunit RPC12/RpoP
LKKKGKTKYEPNQPWIYVAPNKRDKKRHPTSGVWRRETGYVCVKCLTVYNPATSFRHSFCSTCGSKILPNALDSYSALARLPDEEVKDLFYEVTEECGMLDESKSEVKFLEASERLLEVAPRRKTGGEGIAGSVCPKRKRQSKFCDVCGHMNPNLACSSCIASFHAHCVSLPAGLDIPLTGWRCHMCCHEFNRVGKGKLPEPINDDKLCAAIIGGTFCCSCGYHEFETLNCRTCCRGFCYACTCISTATLPEGGWSCPECVGQEKYDEELSERIRVFRERIPSGSLSSKQKVGFGPSPGTSTHPLVCRSLPLAKGGEALPSQSRLFQVCTTAEISMAV